MIQDTIIRTPALAGSNLGINAFGLGRSNGVRFLRLCPVLVFALIANAAQAFDTGQAKTVDGLTVYLGVIAAEIIRGHPPGHPERQAHGGPPRDRHAYHVVVAIFDAATGARVIDAKVSAQVAGLGLGGPTRELEPMIIADTVTYGNYFTLPGKDHYRIIVEIARPQGKSKLSFDYDH